MIVSKLITILIVSSTFAIQASNGIPTDEVKLNFLIMQLDKLQLEVEGLKAENIKLNFQMSTQDKEIRRLKDKITNLESFHPQRSDSHTNAADLDFSNRIERPTPTSSTPPSHCQDLWGYTNFKGMDGIYLIKNDATHKIQAVFCRFISAEEITQEFIGNVDVKTTSVHFYVQKSNGFSTNNAVIPFQLTRLNEGGAMNTVLGIFTATVPGIYHFEFSAVQYASGWNVLSIFLQVNGVDVGRAFTNPKMYESFDVISLGASLRLKAGDRVSLYNRDGDSILYDDENHLTHFTGWLVEEDLD